MKLEFRLLGEIAVLADGHPLELGGARQRSVLALLILQRNHLVTTELLADRLWPDDQPLTATKTIQVYVSRIRHALGPDAGRLMSSASGYRLKVADDELDSARFENCLRVAREESASGSLDASLATLEMALAYWSGPALADLAGEPFARREADRLEELRTQAIEEMLELRIGSGMGREAIGELRRFLGDQPGRERMWRLLMLALYADGRQGEALEAYQDARRYLADELGLDPGPELQALERAILTQELPRLASPGSRASTPAASMLAAKPASRRTRRIVTVLRADVARSYGEDQLDPELIEASERRALAAVRGAVERHGGRIDHADPGGVTAVFGLVIAREDDAMRAVRAALDLRADPVSSNVADPRFCIGLATGEVLAVSNETNGSAISGIPLQVAASLAARAAPHNVLLTTETERLVRATTLTEPLAFESEGSDVARLIGLAANDAWTRPGITPFIGRGPELEALLVAFDRVVSDGQPGLVSVIGAPGVGKSRLVAESFAQISSGARILRSRCLPYGDGITFWPIRELVLAASGITAGEPRTEALARLAVTVPDVDHGDLVRSRLATIVGLSDDPAPGEEIPWAVRRFLEALAADGPVALLVDDLQWAEPALIDVLEHVLDLGRGPILIVTVARPELEETRPDLLARPSLLLVRLDSLDEADSATLLDLLAPKLSSGPLRSRIVDAAEGNPLFFEQLVAYASDDARADGQRLDDRTGGGLTVPPTIGALLAARLDRLPAIERRLLERAAVVGRTFWAGAVADLLPEEERADLSRHLAHLARRDLIRPERSDLPDDEAYRFRHLLIRDAAYASLPKSDRAEHHERFAGWLERRWAAADPGAYDLILGYHLEQAYRYRLELGDDGRDAELLARQALRFIAPAAQAALERGDPHAAASLFRRAVDLAPPGRERIELLIDLAAVLRTAGEREDSDAADAETVSWLTEHPDEGLAHRRRVGEALFVLDGTLAEARDAYTYYERVGDRLGMIRALEVAFNNLQYQARFSEAVEQLDQATTLALEIGRPDRVAGFSWRIAYLFQDCPLPIPEALERCRSCLDLAGDNRESQAITLLAIGHLEAYAGVSDRWRRHFDAANAIFEDLGLAVSHGAAYYAIQLGYAELTAGEPSRVVDLLRWSCATLERHGDLGHLASAAPLTAQLLLALGRLDEVETYAFWGRDIAIVDDLDPHMRWRIAISGLRSHQGRHDEAITLARESVALLARSDFIVSLQLAHLALARALRMAADERGARAAAQDAQRLAVETQNRAILRTIAAFLDVDG